MKPAALVKETDPVETLMVCTLVTDREGIPATVRALAPTANVIATLTLLGLMVRFPVVPLIVKLKPALMVRVVAVTVAFPIVSEPHTALELIVRLIPELMTASSEARGTCPRLHVAPSQVAPAVAVLVCPRACVPAMAINIKDRNDIKITVNNLFIFKILSKSR